MERLGGRPAVCRCVGHDVVGHATVIGHRRVRVPRARAGVAGADAWVGRARDVVPAAAARRGRVGARRRARRVRPSPTRCAASTPSCTRRTCRAKASGGRTTRARRTSRGRATGAGSCTSRAISSSAATAVATARTTTRSGQLVRSVEGRGGDAGRCGTSCGDDRAHVAHLRRRRAGAAGAPRTRQPPVLRRRAALAGPGRRPRRGDPRAARARRSRAAPCRRRRRRLALRLRRAPRGRRRAARAGADDGRPRAERHARQLARPGAARDAAARRPRSARAQFDQTFSNVPNRSSWM